MPEINETEINPQVLFSWKSPLRPYKKARGTVLRFYLALAFLISVIIGFFGDKVLLLPIWALLFLFYILTITPPPDIEHKITRFGIQTSNTNIGWDVLSYFYFTKKFGFEVLTLVTQAPYFYHSYLVIPDTHTKKMVMTILTEHIVYVEKPKKGITEKLIDLFCLLIPADEDSEKPDHQAAASKSTVEPPAPQTSEPKI